MLFIITFVIINNLDYVRLLSNMIGNELKNADGNCDVDNDDSDYLVLLKLRGNI